MSQFTVDAKAAFLENRNLFKKDQERYNLYTALANLSDAIANLETGMDSIWQRINSLEQKMK